MKTRTLITSILLGLAAVVVVGYSIVSAGNGIGNVCECGDQSGDGQVNVVDLIEIQRAIFQPALATPLCDANGDDRCGVSDLVAVNRRIFGARAVCSRNPLP